MSALASNIAVVSQYQRQDAVHVYAVIYQNICFAQHVQLNSLEV